MGRGEIVGLVGENGAGKTTLMRIIAGEILPHSGTVTRSGSVGFVHQHFMLVPEFTIAENLALAGATSEESAIPLGDPGRRVRDLSVGEKAKVELIKAISRRPDVLILDEPTSVLTPPESDELFDTARALAAGGTSVLFISHKIMEVIAIATRIVVMRRGRIVAEGTNMSADELARAMVEVPAESSLRPRPRRAEGHPALQIENFTVAAGEIVAVIGVAGNGQTELAADLRDRLRGNVAHIPEDRTRDGIVAQMDIAENIALAARRWRPRQAYVEAGELMRKFDIRAESPRQRAGSLSGGNQQKLVLAREFSRRPDIIVAAEPTRGLDIESTRFVREQLSESAANGAAILLITSDLDEAFELGDAIHVIYRGRLSARLTPSEAANRAPRLMAGLT